MKKVKFNKEIVTLFLAFLGALIGSVVAGIYEEKLWSKQTAYYEYRKKLDMKAELLRRTAKIWSKQELAWWYRERILIESKLQKDLADLKIYSVYQGDSSNIDINTKDVIYEIEKFNSIRSEYIEIMNLNKIYFGSKVDSLINLVIEEPEWWNIGDSLRQNLLNEMYLEFEENKTTHNKH